MMPCNRLQFFTLSVLFGTWSFLVLCGICWFCLVLSGSVWCFLVLFGPFHSYWYFLVFLDTFWYFFGLVGTSQYFLVLLRHLGGTCWSFLVLLASVLIERHQIDVAKKLSLLELQSLNYVMEVCKELDAGDG